MKIQFKHIKSILLIFLFYWASSQVCAQTMTEIYIPIGQSPGVSGKYSIVGKIEAVNLKDSTATIMDGAGTKTIIKMTAGCAVYLDKSKLKLRNKKGYFIDIKPGMAAEAKYKDNKPGNKIEWLKVQPE
jgi:hypothetical protein